MTADVNDVASAVVARVGRMEAMKLQKLLYYAQAWHLALTDEPLFDDEIQAWSYGPVVRTLFAQHANRRWVNDWSRGDEDRMDDTDIAIVALVCDAYGNLSGDELSSMTHAEMPWRMARRGLPENARSSEPVSHDSMRTFYRTRTLCGRSAADLAAGGLAGLEDTGLGRRERAARLADIRKDYAGTPVHDGGEADTGPTAFNDTADRDFDPTRVRLERARPPRRRAG